MKEQFLETLKEIVDKPIINKEQLEVVKSQTINILTRIYGSPCPQIYQVENIQFKVYMSWSMGNGPSGGGGNNLDKCIENFKGLLASYISEIEKFGIPENTKSDKSAGISINVNQHQSQNQSINIEIILNHIKEELTGKQIKEIKEIVDDERNDEKIKKIKIIAKLKSFGEDVLSNIMANILTNPQIYTSLIP